MKKIIVFFFLAFVLFPLPIFSESSLSLPSMERCDESMIMEWDIVGGVNCLPRGKEPGKDFFYLDIDSAYYKQNTRPKEPPIYEINTTKEFGGSLKRDSVSNCEIDGKKSSSETKICLLDVPEHELIPDILEKTKDIALVLNVPKGMCSYLSITPAWHWNKKPIKGQKLSVGGLDRNWIYYDDQYGLPISVVNSTLEGVKAKIRIRNSASGHSVSAANYMKVLDRASVNGLASQDLPVFLQPFYISESAKIVPNPYHQFACLDESGETKHEIKLLLREWNTLEEFMHLRSSGGISEGNPDISGEEGVLCNYETARSVGGPCNDLCDLDDIATGDDSRCKSSTGYPEVSYDSE